jgi:hypothetical protein
MLYRKLPKTDKLRLKCYQTVLGNDDIYTVENHIIEWDTLNLAQTVYDKLNEAYEQYTIALKNQSRKSQKINRLYRNAEMYLRHFVQVLYMCVQRGEIKPEKLKIYGLDANNMVMPDFRSKDSLLKNGRIIIDGEKERLKKSSVPIYNPSIAKVAVHYDILADAYEESMNLQSRVNKAHEALVNARKDADSALAMLWDDIDKAFAKLPRDERTEQCRKYGIIYYERKEKPLEEDTESQEESESQEND